MSEKSEPKPPQTNKKLGQEERKDVEDIATVRRMLLMMGEEDLQTGHHI